MSDNQGIIIIADGVDSQSIHILRETIEESSNYDFFPCIVGLNGRNPVRSSYTLIRNTVNETSQPYQSLAQVSSPSELKKYDFIVLPDGDEAFVDAMCSSEHLGKVLMRMEKDGKYIGAVGTSIKVLYTHNIHVGKGIVAPPALKNQLAGKYTVAEDLNSIVDGKLITAKRNVFDLAAQIAMALTGKTFDQIWQQWLRK